MTASPAPCVIRDLDSLADYDACVALQDDTWGHGFSERVPGAILRVAQKIGGVAAGAFDDTGRLLGFVFGMTGVRSGALVHWSDMLAVRPEARGTGLGEQLKHYQRDRVRDLGVSIMLWTADPLVARNAHFNINHLGAFPAEYVENMYGDNTGSVLHGAMPTDRIVYRWALEASAPVDRTGVAARGDEHLPAAIAFGADGTPIGTTTMDARQVRIHVPHDLTQIQSVSTALALAWRITVRAAFLTRLGRGDTVTRFVRGVGDTLPYYVLGAGHGT
ncbi:MAG: hypothetical protein H7099_06245 [Gemmatimonadaceae bacterium]|nr:hypothetical protein [Gemmatimonadaceae bacterium]